MKYIYIGTPGLTIRWDGIIVTFKIHNRNKVVAIKKQIYIYTLSSYITSKGHFKLSKLKVLRKANFFRGTTHARERNMQMFIILEMLGFHAETKCLGSSLKTELRDCKRYTIGKYTILLSVV